MYKAFNKFLYQILNKVSFVRICALNFYDSFLAKEIDALDACIFVSFLFGDLLACSSNLANFIILRPILWQLSLICGIFCLVAVFFYLNCQTLKKWIVFSGIAFLLGCLLPTNYLSKKVHNAGNADDVVSLIGVVDFIIPSSFGGKKDAKIVTLKDVNVIGKSRVKNNKYLKVQIYANNKDLNDIEHGHLVKVLVKKKNQAGQILPRGYDFNLRSKLLGIDFTAFSLGKFRVIKAKQEDNLITKLSNLRYKIYKKIRASLPSDIANFASALIIGENQGISPNLKESMRNSGLSHILCVSGLHLSLFSIFCFRLCTFLLNLFPYLSLKYNLKIFIYIASFFLSGFYWALSGMNVATTRAFVMSSVTIFASIIDRRAHSIRILGLATVIVLLINPEDALSPSFQLSFAATLSLITSKFISINWFSNFSGIFRIFHILLNKVANSIYLSSLVSIATAPIVIYHFYSFSTYQALANLFAVPITGFFLMPCVIGFFVFILFGASAFILQLMHIGIAVVIKIANYFAALPYSVVYFGRLDSYYAITSFLGIFIFQAFKQKFFRNLGLIICILPLVLGYNSIKPDLLIDINKSAIGVKSDDKLIIYGSSSSKFLKRYWSSWFGQKEIMFYKVDLETVAFKHTTKFSKKILIIRKNCNDDNKKEYFDVVINLANNDKNFNANNVFATDQLLPLGNFVIFIKKDKCILQGVNGSIEKIPLVNLANE